MKRGRVRVGCSGWQYRDWRGRFYPRELPVDRWLEHYATVFDTVEINSSFYRLPSDDAVDDWRGRAPRGFLFAWKASRFLTHMKKLKDPEDAVARLFARAGRLGPKLGPVLYQLPPGWGPNVDRLEAFLAAVPRRSRTVLEVRDPRWYAPEVFAALARRRAALCLHDMPGSAIDDVPRAGPFLYVRFHGAEARYRGGYGRAHLGEWAARMRDAAGRGHDVFAYFNNDVEGHAPRDALRLRELLG